MNKIILADSQAIFRAGTAKVLAMDEDSRIIAQCSDVDRLYHAITTFPNSIVLFAASLHPDFPRMKALLDAANSRGIVIAENGESASSYLQQGFRGVVFRSVNGSALAECVRRVGLGETWVPPQLMQHSAPDDDMVGTRVRDRLTPKEMRIVALIVQGCKNRLTTWASCIFSFLLMSLHRRHCCCYTARVAMRKTCCRSEESFGLAPLSWGCEAKCWRTGCLGSFADLGRACSTLRISRRAPMSWLSSSIQPLNIMQLVNGI